MCKNPATYEPSVFGNFVQINTHLCEVGHKTHTFTQRMGGGTIVTAVPASFRVAWGRPALTGRPPRPGAGRGSPAELTFPSGGFPTGTQGPRPCRSPVWAWGGVIHGLQFTPSGLRRGTEARGRSVTGLGSGRRWDWTPGSRATSENAG